MERNGAPIEVDTRKAIALAAYLAVSARAQGRDTLAGLLWPDYDQSSARATLRRTLSALKKAIGDEWLEIDRDQIGLRHGPGLWIDVEYFRQRLAETARHGHPVAEACPQCVGPLSEAVEAWRGPFLSGFTARESPDFEEWQAFQDEQLTRELSGALERLADALALRGDYGQAISYARRWLALDPLHEPAHRRLMLLHAWAGDRASALRQYRECVRVLDAELGVAPLAETTQLAEEIKEGRGDAETRRRGDAENGLPLPLGERRGEGPLPASPRPRVPASNLPHSPTLPLVGRSAEWSLLRRTYESAGPNGHVLVLEGEAGIGKTRLAEEFVAWARSMGAPAILARCYEGEAALAYGPIVEGLRAALAEAEVVSRLEALPEHWLSEAARLLPEVGKTRPIAPPAPALDSPGAQTRFFEGLSAVILAIASGGGPAPGVIFLDDLHWADEASLDLLTYLVRRLQGRPLYVLATWRSDRVPADHRLRRLLADARRGGYATSLPLTRLSLPEVQDIVRSVVSRKGAKPEELGESLFRETEGLPFFLVEYLDAVLSDERSTAVSVPGGVRDLLRSRLAGVSERGMQVLTAAAAIGRSFDFDSVREASGRGEDEVVAALEELVARGLIREVHLTFDFTHERLRELVYEETSLVRRRLLHRRVAAALRARARAARQEGALAGHIAQHYQLAGQNADAAHYFKLAGEYAHGVYANAEALAHFRSALALGHADSTGLHQAIGDLLVLAGEYGAARRSYELAAALSDATRLPAVEHKLGNLYRRQGEWDLAESHFEAALGALGADASPADRARLYADWSLISHRRGQAERAVGQAQRALELAETADDTQALAQAHNILGILASSRGQLGPARAHLERSLDLADALRDGSARVAALNNLALVHRASDEIDQALELTEAALALCVAQGDRHREAALHNNLADLLHASGRSNEAMAHLRRSVSILAEIGAEIGSLQPEIWKLTEW